MNFLKDFSAQAAISGVLAAFVGFCSSFAVILQGLYSVGATTAQASSGIMILCIAMGIGALFLSTLYRMPISIAWSTPGGAMLAGGAALDGGFAAAVGGFVICGVLLVLAGLVKPLGRLVAAIPASLASAMLAGILFELCLAPVRAVADYPLFALPIIVAWLVAGRFSKLLAVPFALATFFVVTLFGMNLMASLPEVTRAGVFTQLVWVTPEFSMPALASIALPLFIVTMSSQNIPGMGVLKANNYEPDANRLFSVTGFLSMLSAPFGGHAVNLAAITAALCASEEAHAEKHRRYWAALVAGTCYLVIAAFAGLIIRLVTLAPGILIQAVAGLALIGTCAAAMVAAFSQTEHREAAAITFFITAAGLSFAGISGAFWGLVAGWIVYIVQTGKWRRAA